MRVITVVALMLGLAACAAPTPMYGPTPGGNYNPVAGTFNLGP